MRHALIDNLKEFGNCFQNVPYGKSFRRWMSDYLEKQPCNSFSNGSAMRFSPVGCLFDSLEKAQKSPTIPPEASRALKPLPQAIEAFPESSDFEDSIRTAVSFGGDSDTIAEAFYGIPEEIRSMGTAKIPPMLMEVLEKFQRFTER